MICISFQMKNEHDCYRNAIEGTCGTQKDTRWVTPVSPVAALTSSSEFNCKLILVCADDGHTRAKSSSSCGNRCQSIAGTDLTQRRLLNSRGCSHLLFYIYPTARLKHMSTGTFCSLGLYYSYNYDCIFLVVSW